MTWNRLIIALFPCSRLHLQLCWAWNIRAHKWALENGEHKSKFVVFYMIQTFLWFRASPIFTDLKYSSCPIMLALWLQRISVRVQCLDRQSHQLSSSMKKLPARPSTLKIEMDLNNLLHETASWLILFVIQISNAGPFTQLSCKTASCSSLTKDNDTNISTLWALNGGGSRLPNLFVVKSKEIISSILFLLPTLILFLAKRWVFLSETHHFDKKSIFISVKIMRDYEKYHW